MDVVVLGMINALKKGGGAGYVESTKKILLPEQTFEPTEIQEGAGLYVFEIDPPLSPVNGDKFTVNWNGTQYVCETISTVQDGYLIFGFGNQGLMGGDGDTGEPFIYSEMEGDTGMFVTLGTEPVTVSVIVERETVHAIDPKFLPSGTFDVYFDMMGLMGGSNPYMYKTNETGDTTQRVTAEELHKALTDNKTVRVIMVQPNAPEGTIAVFAPASVTAMPSMGAIGIVLDAGSMAMIYTAEYTE